jgi:hypothetical protein
MGKASANAVEVQSKTLRWVEQFAGGLVERKMAGPRFLEDAFTNEMFEHSVQHVCVALSRCGKVVYVVQAGGDVISNSKRGCYVNAPGRAEIG